MKTKNRSIRNGKAQRRAIRRASALSPDRQALTAVYALGIRDGLRIAADIHEKTKRSEGDA
ncbi:MAG: hypothetical protein ABIG45_08840 [Bacillota bacterium]